MLAIQPCDRLPKMAARKKRKTITTNSVPKTKAITPVGNVKVTLLGPSPKLEHRVQVCGEGLSGPYVLCEPNDYNAVRVFLLRRKYVMSTVPDAITDSSSEAGRAMASQINLPELKARDVMPLQKKLDKAFPARDTASVVLHMKVPRRQ